MDDLPFTLGKNIGIDLATQVHEAILKSNGKRVCVKSIDKNAPNADVLQIKREVESWKLLRHPNCVQFIDSVFTNDKCYIIMELVDGGTLENLIEEQKQIGPFEEQFLLKIFSQLASALLHCHDNMVIHRDVKPANVLLTKDLDAKICDFGLSKVISELNHSTPTKKGTFAYISPELILNDDYSFPTDVWSLGVVFYQMMTFNYPFEGRTNSELFHKIIELDPDPIDNSYSKPFKKMVIKMLNKDPHQRITLTEILSLSFMPKNPFDSNLTYMSVPDLVKFGNENLKENQYLTARECFLLAAKRGDVESAYQYGYLLAEGKLGKPNLSDSFKYLCLAAEKKCIKAMIYLGKKLRKGFLGNPPSQEESISYLKMAVDADPANNDYKLEYGKTLWKLNRCSEALTIFKSVGNGEAYYQLGKLESNPQAAIEYYLKSSELGCQKGIKALDICLTTWKNDTENQ